MFNAASGAIPSGSAEGQAILSGRAKDQATNRGERKLLTRIFTFGVPMLLVAVFLVAYHAGEMKGSNHRELTNSHAYQVCIDGCKGRRKCAGVVDTSKKCVTRCKADCANNPTLYP